MFGIYIHIPFCQHACAYCDFFFTVRSSGPALKEQTAFVNALVCEIDSYASDLTFSGKKVSSIYFGGGTPSLLSLEVFQKVLFHLFKKFEIDDAVEITVEINPEDVDLDLAAGLSSLGVSRISLGVQSLWADCFEYLGRRYVRRDEVLEKIALFYNQGIENISVDLILGFPSLTDQKISEDINCLAKQKGVRHFSTYLLTVEKKTRLQKEVAQKKKLNVDSKQQAHQYQLAFRLLKQKGFHRYEVSNYCTEDHYSAHNCGYWLGRPYLGIGPSAHSFDGKNRRRVNVANLPKYLARWKKKCEPSELWPKDQTEKLDENTLYQEMLLTRLRTKWGLCLCELFDKLGADYYNRLQEMAKPLLQEGLLEKVKVDGRWCYRISEKGILYADGITRQLFI